MLILPRRRGESITIADDVTVTVIEVRGDKVRLGIVCPPGIAVHRQEVWAAIHPTPELPGVAEERAWLACTSPQEMLTLLLGKVSDRKLRLVACACCRSVWQAMPEDCRRVVELAERAEDDPSALPKVEAIWDRMQRTSAFPPVGSRDGAAYAAARYASTSDGRAAVLAVQSLDALPDASARQCGLLRDVFGPRPFRPISVEACWLTSDVVGIARAAYEDREFDLLPILADALQEAGCAEPAILAHCRESGDHVRGCWVVDLLTGRE